MNVADEAFILNDTKRQLNMINPREATIHFLRLRGLESISHNGDNRNISYQPKDILFL
jgi:hypothetical protein